MVVAGPDDHCASIYVKDPTSIRSSFAGQKRPIPVHKAIAFNVEKTVAMYIVEAHNARVLWSPHDYGPRGQTAEPESWIGNNFLDPTK